MHLRIFGCIAYVRVRGTNHDKLDLNASKCQFIGYGSDEMRYLFLNRQKVGKSNNVAFNEKVLYKNRLAAGTMIKNMRRKRRKMIWFLRTPQRQ